MTPIYQTSTYVQPRVAEPVAGSYDYGRTANPTREALEANVAALENGLAGVAFASGLAAISAVASLLSAGDHVVCESNTYGGTSRLFDHVLARHGLSFTYVDARDLGAVSRALRPETRLVHVETPTNPLMRVSDIRALADLARGAGARLAVDNTFASPYNQRPLELGADFTIHSATKYVNGHSDVISGLVVVRDPDLADQLLFVRKSVGSVPGPMDCWLTLRGAKTLHVRMERHNRNAMSVASYLEADPRVRRVFYPGLESHPEHAVARSQMSGFSGMMSADFGTLERARRFAERLSIFSLGESLGGVESLVSVPALMTHASLSEQRLKELGLGPGLVRLSIGIEDADDLIGDLDQALAD